MGKRQHQKDKLYLTSTEWRTLYGGKQASNENDVNSRFRRLPFDHCALSLQPFEHPYCNSEGFIFDLKNITQYLKKFKVDPINGKPFDAKSLIKLNFYKNNDGQYHCPVLYKPFTENSHIVAIKATGNVFCFEAVEQLNLKAKNFRDLLNDTTFTKNDIIMLLDPKALDKYNVESFYHVKKKLRWEGNDEEQQKDARHSIRKMNYETQTTLKELEKLETKSTEDKTKTTSIKPDKINAAHYSTGMVAAGFTSTVMEPTTKSEAAVLDDDVVRYSRIKKKGYVQLQTNLGPLYLELYSDQTPKACDNFIKLCKKGYYDNTSFHRSIKNFMIQGGDPTGTGKGGESIWGKPFEDEFRPQYAHQGRGVLSMANSGTNTNKSQFFITYRSCRHLDNKHTIFGKMVGGLETLDKMERIETDVKSRPKQEIKIVKAVVFVDPFQEVDDAIAAERQKLNHEQTKSEMKTSQPANERKPLRRGIGAFIDFNKAKDEDNDEDETETSPPIKKKHTGRSTFGDFSNW